MTPLNVFVTEGNVEIYLSRLYNFLDPAERDNVLRLLIQEQANMGLSRAHLENGERRVMDGRERLKRQRIVVAEHALEESDRHHSTLFLETLERTQELLEEHLRFLRNRHEQTKL